MPDPTRVYDAMRKIPVETLPLLSRLIDFEILEQCARIPHTGKATGADGIPIEFYRHGPQSLSELRWVALLRICERNHSLFVHMNGLV
jgi:hypothetical protein